MENEVKLVVLEVVCEVRKRVEEEVVGGVEVLERVKVGLVVLIKEDGGKIMNLKIVEYYMKV